MMCAKSIVWGITLWEDYFLRMFFLDCWNDKMKTFIKIARLVVYYLYGRNVPDFASTYIPSVHHPHRQGDEYLAGMPRRARHDDYLASFSSRPIAEVKHCWRPPSSSRLPVDDWRTDTIRLNTRATSKMISGTYFMYQLLFALCQSNEPLLALRASTLPSCKAIRTILSPITGNNCR